MRDEYEQIRDVLTKDGVKTTNIIKLRGDKETKKNETI